MFGKLQQIHGQMDSHIISLDTGGSKIMIQPLLIYDIFYI